MGAWGRRAYVTRGWKRHSAAENRLQARDTFHARHAMRPRVDGPELGHHGFRFLKSIRPRQQRRAVQIGTRAAHGRDEFQDRLVR